MDIFIQISVLLKTNVSKLPLKHRLIMKELEEPLPNLDLTQLSESKIQNRNLWQRFPRNMYNRNSWICGCEETDSFPRILWYNSAFIAAGHYLLEKIKKNMNHL